MAAEDQTNNQSILIFDRFFAVDVYRTCLPAQDQSFSSMNCSCWSIFFVVAVNIHPLVCQHKIEVFHQSILAVNQHQIEFWTVNWSINFDLSSTMTPRSFPPITRQLWLQHGEFRSMGRCVQRDCIFCEACWWKGGRGDYSSADNMLTDWTDTLGLFMPSSPAWEWVRVQLMLMLRSYLGMWMACWIACRQVLLVAFILRIPAVCESPPVYEARLANSLGTRLG